MTDRTASEIPIRPCSAVVAQAPHKGQADGFDSRQGLQINQKLSEYFGRPVKLIKETEDYILIQERVEAS